MLAQHAIDKRYGQPHHVEVAAFDAGDEARSEALNGVAAGLVKGFTTFDVTADFIFGQVSESNVGCFVSPGQDGFWRADESHPCNYAMRMAGERAQHPGGVSGIDRFLQDFSVDGHHGVGAQNQARGV